MIQTTCRNWDDHAHAHGLVGALLAATVQHLHEPNQPASELGSSEDEDVSCSSTVAFSLNDQAKREADQELDRVPKGQA